MVVAQFISPDFKTFAKISNCLIAFIYSEIEYCKMIEEMDEMRKDRNIFNKGNIVRNNRRSISVFFNSLCESILVESICHADHTCMHGQNQN